MSINMLLISAFCPEVLKKESASPVPILQSEVFITFELSIKYMLITSVSQLFLMKLLPFSIAFCSSWALSGLKSICSASLNTERSSDFVLTSAN